MAENKTQRTDASVDGYLAAIADEARRKDCEDLVKLISKATRLEPAMWGASIVGFGSYHYKYESGREGDMCLVGFSSRKGDISIYLSGSFPQRETLLASLGKHKVATACLYIRKLKDIDTEVLGRLVVESVAEVRRRNG